MDSNEEYFVYKLTDPRTGLIRYIGMSMHPYQRFGAHLMLGENNLDKNKWIQELAKEHLIPEIGIIEKVAGSRESTLRRETHWIQHYLKEGMPLTNVLHVDRDSIAEVLNDNQIYNATEFANLVGVTVKTLQRWDREGVLVAGRTITNRRYYTKEHYSQVISA